MGDTGGSGLLWQAGPGICETVAGRLGPVAEIFHAGGGAVTEPAVELSGVLELLAPVTWDYDEIGLDLRERGHVAPQLFKLGYREHIFLAVSPAFFDVFQGDISGHTGGDLTDAGLNFFSGAGGC